MSEKKWYLWTFPNGASHVYHEPTDQSRNPDVVCQEVRLLPVHDSGDLLQPEEREAVERVRESCYYNKHPSWDTERTLIAALDRIAPKPAPAWEPKKGDSVRWEYGDFGGTAEYVGGYPHEPMVILPSCDPFHVDRVEPLKE